MQQKSHSLRLSGVLGVALATLAACAPASPGRPGPEPRAAAGHALIPAPADLRLSGGAPFAITAATTIRVQPGSAEVERIAEQFAHILRPSTGFPLPV